MSKAIQISHFLDSWQTQIDSLIEYEQVDNDAQLKQYIEVNQKHLGETVLLRFAQSIVNYWHLDTELDRISKRLKKEVAARLFATFAYTSNSHFMDTFSEMFKPLIQNTVSLAVFPTKHANFCMLLSLFSRKWATAICLNGPLLAYLARVLQTVDNRCLQYYAILCIDKLASSSSSNRQLLISSQIDDSLEAFIDRHLFKSLQEPIIEHRSQQLAHYARWCLLNVFSLEADTKVYSGKLRETTKATKAILNANDQVGTCTVSVDGLTVSNATSAFSSIFATCSVSSGVHFYEVELLTEGLMQIGWATKESRFSADEGDGVGDDKYSLAIDGYRQSIWHNETRFPINQMPKWKSGDLIGCLIDVPNESFIFYLNGREFDARHWCRRIEFREKPYFPAVSLAILQKVAFNFGQKLFAFPPKERAFSDLSGKRHNEGKLDIDNYVGNLDISPDKLTITNETGFSTIRAVASVSSGVYFYEVDLFTDECLQIGWATSDNLKTLLLRGKGIGDDLHSVAIDAYRCRLWHQESYRVPSMPTWKIADTVGCLIDVPRQNFLFYLNGQLFNGQAIIPKIRFSTMPYYPAISLSNHQKAEFNFGQKPFKYPPKDLPFSDFCNNAYNQRQLGKCGVCTVRPAELEYLTCEHYCKLCSLCVSILEKCPKC